MSELIAVDGMSIIVGMCGSGKSHLLKYCLYMLWAVDKAFDFVIIYTNTPQDYKFINPQYIHAGYSDNDLRKVLRVMRDFENKGIQKKILFIFDDVIGMIPFNSKLMAAFNTQFCKFNATVVYSVQFLSGAIPPGIREQSFRACFFKPIGEDAFKALYRQYGQRYGKFKDFQKFVDQNTDDHQFIAVDNKAPSTEKRPYKPMKIPPNIPEFYIDF